MMIHPSPHHGFPKTSCGQLLVQTSFISHNNILLPTSLFLELLAFLGQFPFVELLSVYQCAYTSDLKKQPFCRMRIVLLLLFSCLVGRGVFPQKSC
jgi:hypothetical protein